MNSIIIKVIAFCNGYCFNEIVEEFWGKFFDFLLVSQLNPL